MKWAEGDQVVWRAPDGRDIVATVQPGPCSEGPQFVHITWHGYSSVVWQDDLRLAIGAEIAASSRERA